MRYSLHFACGRLAIVIGCVVTLVLAPALQGAGCHKVLYSFTDGPDGAYPNSVILDTAGNLYGPAWAGGDLNCSNDFPNSGCGVVFELTPSGNGESQERVLYAFQGGTDGIGPNGLIFGADGNLYGTTQSGGTDNFGTVFELSPNGDGNWTESILYSFQNGSDGSQPSSPIFDTSGNLYGISYGYASNAIFELSPPKQKGGNWTETTIYTTGNGSYTWLSGLVFDRHGNLYGGWYPNVCCGGVFELKQVGKSWQYTDLYDFLGGGNGGEPLSGVLLGNQGNMYGTGIAGGNDWGIAFELRRVRGEWTQIMLHNFCSRNKCADGAWPFAGLVFDQVGNLYGTTEVGGAACPGDGCGVVFRLSPAKRGKWAETVLHSFKGGLDGYGPLGGVILDGKRDIFGVTEIGGTSSGQGYGTVFEITP